MGKLQEKLQKQEFVLTAEISPPKGAGIKKLKEHVQLLSPHVTAINITDSQRSIVRMASWAACKVILELGAEPVYQLTCRDRNAIGLQSDLMGASALGIPNLLCLTGDPVKVGDHPTSKSVFEMESTGLLKMVSTLQTGRDAQSNKMNAPTRFFVGAVVNPTHKGSSTQLERMKKKREAGARFFQTQANYDLEDLSSFLNSTKEIQAPVLVGILILHSAKIAHYIHENIPGIQLPSQVLKRMESAVHPEKEGIAIAVETMKMLEGQCAGFHLMTIRQEHLIPELVRHFYA